MLKLPPKVRIGPYDYKLIVVDKIKDDEECWGLCEQGKLSITVSRAQPNSLFAVDTVVHEILHAIYVNAGLQPVSTEESVCSAIATGLTQVFRDNPKLLAWVTKAVKNTSAT